MSMEIPTRPTRTFLPDDFIIDSWDRLYPYFEDLEKRAFNSIADLENG